MSTLCSALSGTLCSTVLTVITMSAPCHGSDSLTVSDGSCHRSSPQSVFDGGRLCRNFGSTQGTANGHRPGQSVRLYNRHCEPTGHNLGHRPPTCGYHSGRTSKSRLYRHSEAGGLIVSVGDSAGGHKGGFRDEGGGDSHRGDGVGGGGQGGDGDGFGGGGKVLGEGE